MAHLLIISRAVRDFDHSEFLLEPKVYLCTRVHPIYALMRTIMLMFFCAVAHPCHIIYFS